MSREEGLEARTSNHEVFLSHTSSDKPVVERIALRLRAAGVTPWLDRWNLIPGEPWQPVIEEALMRCASVAVFIGPKGLAPWHNEEMRAAIQRRVTEARFRVIPVLLPGAVPEQRGKLPPFLTAATWVELPTEDDPEALRRLVCGIRGLPPGPGPTGVLRVDKKPYRGLQPFDVDDADIYFGREALTQDLLERLGRTGPGSTRFMAILGPSGSGKSSLARAGLLAALKVGKLPGSESWPQAIIRPGRAPLEALAVGIRRLWPNLEYGARDLATRFAEDERELHLDTKEALPNDAARFVLLVDQAEELFSQCADEASRRAFLSNVMYAATVESGQVLAILAMRADFYPSCAAYPQLRALVSENQVLVGAMTPEELRSAIEAPASRVHRPLRPELVERLLHDLAERAGALPLLEHALDMLWELPGQSPGVEAYDEIGGVGGALNARAESVFRSLSGDEKTVARQLFLRLVQPGEGTADTRRRVAGSELSDEQRHIGEQFAEMGARLLVWGGDESGQYVELAHEALMSEWKRLARWLAEDRDGRRIHQRLTTAATEWASLGRPEDELYRRSRLSEVEDWLQTLPGVDADGVLNTLEQDFLAQSKERLERAERERAAEKKALERAIEDRATAAKLALQEAEAAKRQRNVAVSRELASQALAKLEKDPVLSLSLLKTATRLAQTEQLDIVLTQWASSLLRAVARHADSVLMAEFSPDGRRVVTASNDKTARVWDPHTGSLLAELKGHAGSVYTAGFNPDGQHIVTASKDGTARIWSSRTGSLVAELKGHTGPVYTAEFSPDGQRVVTVGDDRTARIWDPKTGSAIAELKGHTDAVRTAEFSPRRRRVVTASDDKTARIWDSETGSLTQELKGHTDAVRTVEFSPNGRRVVTASLDGTARVWNPETGSLIQKLEGHAGSVLMARFSPDGRRVVTASLDGTARIWSSKVGSLIQELKGHTDSVRAAEFSPDGRRVVTASDDKTIRIWDPETGSLVQELRGHAGWVATVALSPDGRRMVTASTDKTARVWEPQGSSLVAVLEGHTGPVYTAEISPDGRRVVTAGDDKTARVWDSRTGSLTAVLEGHMGPVYTTEISPDGRRVVTASDDKTARVWDLLTGLLVAELKGHMDLVRTAGFSPDGRRVVTTSDDKTVRIWDPGTGSLLSVLKGHKDLVRTAEFSPDGRRLVTASDDKTARIWDSKTGFLVAELKGHRGPVYTAAFSPDGRLVVTASLDNTARVWDAQTGSLVVELKGHTDPVCAAEFSPDGRRVVTASLDDTARIWDPQTGSLVAEFKGHMDSVRTASFSPDGRRVVTASLDDTAKIWDPQTGSLIKELEGHMGSVCMAKFSRDGLSVATASADGFARLWRDDPAWWPRERQLQFLDAVRDLSPEERRLYLHEDDSGTTT